MSRIAPILLCLAACSSTPNTLERGSYRPPPAAPAFSPTLDAPHTTGQPGPRARDVPRSPYTRVLPQTPETRRQDGIWASDVPMDLPDLPMIDETEIPFPAEAETDGEKFLTRECAMMMNGSTGIWDPIDKRLTWRGKERRCLAALLFAACVDAVVQARDARREAGEYFRDVEGWLPATVASATKFHKESCSGVPMPKGTDKMVKSAREPTAVLLLGDTQRIFK